LNNPVILYMIIGLTAGMASGFFGIGGGIIVVPALVYLAGFNHLTATGTSLAVFLFPVGLAGALAYHRHGNVNLKAAVIIAFCIFISAYVSARIAIKLNTLYIKLSFGIFIILVGIYIVWGAIHQMSR